jgi:hypothetical protein
VFILTENASEVYKITASATNHQNQSNAGEGWESLKESPVEEGQLFGSPSGKETGWLT